MEAPAVSGVAFQNTFTHVCALKPCFSLGQEQIPLRIHESKLIPPFLRRVPIKRPYFIEKMKATGHTWLPKLRQQESNQR